MRSSDCSAPGGWGGDRAHDTRLGRDVALKGPAYLMGDDRGRIRRLTNEARAAASLNHPHSAPFSTSAQARRGASVHRDGAADGESLRQRLAGGPMDVAQIIDLAIGLADALRSVDARRRPSHRAQKCGNVVDCSSPLDP